MRRLLRNLRTGEYSLSGDWTANAAEAHGFQSIKGAMDAAIEYQLPDVEAVLQFGSKPSDVYDCHLTLGVSQKTNLDTTGTNISSVPNDK